MRLALSACTLVVSLAPLSCCGQPKFEPYASIDGPFVRVRSSALQSGDVLSASGVTDTIKAGEYTGELVIPADKVGAGDKSIEVTLTRGGKTATRKVKVVVPAEALAPQLQLGDCVKETDEQGGKGSGVRAAPLGISTDAWVGVGRHTPGLKAQCYLRDEGRARVHVGSHSDATVTIGGTPVKLVGGRGEHAFELGPLVHDLTLAEVLQDDPQRMPVAGTLDATVSRGGKSRTYKIGLSTNRNDLRDSMARALTEWKGKAPLPWPHAPHGGGARAAVLVTLRTPIEVDGKTEPTVSTTYANPLAVGPSGAKADEVDLVARATPVDVTRSGTCTGYNTVYGSGSVRNAVFKMGLEVEVFSDKGASVAKRKFPAPAKTECPDSISGVQGKTTLLLYYPDSKAVLDWVESVRKSAK